MIFISHSTSNDSFVNQLADELHIRGLQTWIDHRDMPAGSRWVAQLETALMESEVMLLVLSESAINSSYVESEWHTFFNMGRKIIPLLLEDCPVPLFLRTFHQVDFRGEDFSRQIEALLEVLPLSSSKTTRSDKAETEDNSVKSVAATTLLPKHSEILQRAHELIDTKALTLYDGFIQFILPIDEVILQYPLNREILIGRSHRSVQFQPDLDLNPYIYSAMVSRRHASLMRDADKLYIKDLESSNGTFLGDIPLPPQEYVPLENFSLIFLSQHFPILIRYQF